jgi:modification methylase
VRLARDRIAATERLDDNVITLDPAKRAEPRVPFGAVVERGLLPPGAVLYDPSRRYMARVRADGTVISDRAKGSIHQVGAELQGAPSCNGWTFWHFEVKGKLVPIDILRQQIRSEMH